MTSADTDTGWDDHLTGWVKVSKAQIVHVTEVWFGVFDLGHLVIVFDDFIQDGSKYIVAFGVTGVDTNTAV